MRPGPVARKERGKDVALPLSVCLLMFCLLLLLRHLLLGLLLDGLRYARVG